jgi:hypothetical protein
VHRPIFSLIQSDSPFSIAFNSIELFILASFVVLDLFVEVVKYQGLLTTESQTLDPLEFIYTFILSLHEE